MGLQIYSAYLPFIFDLEVCSEKAYSEDYEAKDQQEEIS